MLTELKKENQLLQLQRKYEASEVREEELSEEQKEELLALYKKEIANLEIELANNQKKLESYKAKIIEKRKMSKKKI